MSGFLSGTFWGAFVGAGALVVSGLSLDRQELSFPKPEAAAVEVPGGSEFDQARPEAETVLPTTESRPDADVVAAVEAPEDAGDTPPQMDTASLDAPKPELDAPTGLGEAPETPVTDQPEVATDAAPAVDVGGDALTAPETPGDAPTAEVEDPVAPAAEEETAPLDVATSTEDSATDSTVDGGETQIAALPETVTEEAQPETMPVPEVTSLDDAPEAPVQPDVGGDSGLADTGGSSDASDAGLSTSPEAPKLPQVTEEPSLPSGNAPDIAEEAPEAPANPATDGSSGAETIRVDGGPSILVPVDELEDQAEGVETARLPQTGISTLPTVRRIGVGDATDAAVDAPEGDADALDVDVAPQDGPALDVFRSEFENVEGRPLVSVVLVHSGAAALSSDVLEGLPEHVSFAVDAGIPDAAAVAKAYRDSGREVVMIPSLPAGAQPQDVEQALRVNFETIPEAVAVMDITGSSFQSDRAAIAQVVEVVSASGHGVITFPRGLNAAHQEAQRAGVPTGLIFRNLDGGSETQEQIRRVMDRAAFRARQNEGVILVGTTQDATLAALVEWALGNRAASVTIAPVSAALQP